MDVLSAILLLVILVLIIVNQSTISNKFKDLEYRIMDLQKLLKLRDGPKKEAETPRQGFEAPVQHPPAIKTPMPPKPAEIKSPGPPPLVEVKIPEQSKPEEAKPAMVVERQKDAISDPLSQIRRPVKTWEPPIKHPAQQHPNEPRPSFFEQYPDLEKFIGENLVNKIGIAILVLAIGFFVKYAIDNNWIGPVGRVGIGILCGGILVAFAHRMRNNYKAFSSVLAGGGLAIFYFTITLAFQQFHLFAQPIALAILTVITVFSVALALLYDKQELAVISLIGGFASPFLVSNGRANYNGLFLYLLILNTGLLIIAYYKAWRILNISAFVLSVAVFSTVLFTLTAANYYIALRYATIFYLLFFTTNIINNIRENKNFLAIDFTILLVNTALYFAVGLYFLTEMGETQYRGLFSAALALINLVLSYILFRKKTVDPNVLYLLIGITLTFISLTAPIQLHGNNITLFWASETVLLYWLHLKSRIKLMKLTSLLVWLAMIMSLCIDLSKIYGYPLVHLDFITNKGFITTIFASVSSYVLCILIKKDPSPQIYGMAVSGNFYRIISFILLFISGFLEINHQFNNHFPGTDLNILYLMLYIPVFVYLFYTTSARINGDRFNWRIGMGLLVCSIVVYLLFIPSTFDLLRDMLEQKKTPISHFAVHWISALFIGLIFYKVIILSKDYFEDGIKNATAWILSAAVVLFLSLEFCLAAEQLFYSGPNPVDLIQTVYVKTGLPVLWGVSSFILMWIGMRKKLRTLRIISLSLFLITLLKLFLFDINNIPVAGKIIAFFCLGILLLIISFMYQKVKKIIVDDKAKAKE